MGSDDGRGFAKLEVYQRSFALIKPMYEFAKGLPRIEQHDMASQIRRACKSVPANIAEGYGRRSTPKELCRYLAFATGSSNEMESHIAMAHELGYASHDFMEEYVEEYRIIGRQLTRLIQYWRSRPEY